MRLGTDEHAKTYDLYRNEQSQTRVRVGICLFMAVYFYITGYTNHPLYVFFIIYCLTLYSFVRIWRRFFPSRIILSITIDNFCTIAGLHVTGEQGTFLFVLLIQITLGNGLRYGRFYLWYSVISACIGLTVLYHYSFPWKGNVHLAIAYILGVPFVAFYIDFLVRELQRSKEFATKRAAEVEELLAFVAHDVRNPLHALLTTTSIARAETSDDLARVRLTRIETGIRSLARLATSILGSAANREETRSVVETVSLHAWVVEICRRFSDEIETRSGKLVFTFDFDFPTLVAFNTLIGERLLTNTLSNAARYCWSGQIAVKVENLKRHPRPFLRISVLNTGGSLKSSGAPNETSEAATVDYHGSGMGLMIATELASSVGGTFSYARSRAREHVTYFDLPLDEPQLDAEYPIPYPVVIVTADETLINQYKSALSSETTIVAFRSFEKFLKSVSLRTLPIAALFLDAQMMSKAGFPGRTADQMGTLEPVCLIRSPHDEHPPESCSYIFSALERSATRHEIINAVNASAAFRGCRVASLPICGVSLGRRLSRRKLLFVDDNQTILNLVEERLKDSEIEFETASNSSEALSMLSSNSFDAVLLDWNLGLQTSESVVKEVAKNRKLDDTKLFVFSAERADRIKLSSTSNRITKIIERPLDLSTALSTVADLLDGADSGAIRTVQTRGNHLFDASIYEEMAMHNSPAERIYDVLRRFEQDSQNLRSQIDQAFEEADLEKLRKAMHGLNSVCLAGGARVVSECIERADSQIDDFRTHELSAYEELIECIAEAWRLTEIHIAWYAESLKQ